MVTIEEAEKYIKQLLEQLEKNTISLQNASDDINKLEEKLKDCKKELAQVNPTVRDAYIRCATKKSFSQFGSFR